MKKKSTLLIVAGGTGGHISPGLALAESAVARGLRVVFLSIPRNRDYPEFQNPPWKMEWYPAPAPKKNPLALPGFMLNFVSSILKAIRLLIRERPVAVLALGGYSALPAITAALILRIPFFLCEQNAVAGRVTKALSGFARGIFLTFPAENLYGKNLLLTGNPIRRNLRERARGRRSAPGRIKKSSRSMPVILALGGSQGAVQLNEMLLLLWKQFPGFSARYRWILQTGRDHLQKMSARLEAEVASRVRGRVELFGFDSDIYRYYERGDVFVGRAGAGNITEAALFSLPMVLIPYPFAKDAHQKANALSVVRAGAGLMVDRLDTQPEELMRAIEQVIEPGSRKSMGDRSRELARDAAADQIIDMLMPG